MRAVIADPTEVIWVSSRVVAICTALIQQLCNLVGHHIARKSNVDILDMLVFFSVECLQVAIVYLIVLVVDTSIVRAGDALACMRLDLDDANCVQITNAFEDRTAGIALDLVAWLALRPWLRQYIVHC
jgi:hypothetical protein